MRGCPARIGLRPGIPLEAAAPDLVFPGNSRECNYACFPWRSAGEEIVPFATKQETGVQCRNEWLTSLRNRRFAQIKLKEKGSEPFFRPSLTRRRRLKSCSRLEQNHRRCD